MMIHLKRFLINRIPSLLSLLWRPATSLRRRLRLHLASLSLAARGRGYY